MEKARDEFLDLLINYRNARQHDITVVFDGYKSGVSAEQVAVRGRIKIIYSRLGERADDVIKRIISHDRREWIVVSLDRDIVNFFWSVNSIPLPSDKFFEIISKRVEEKEYSEMHEVSDKEGAGMLSYSGFEDDFEGHQIQKGNPHKLSKKEKAFRRALSKL